MIALGLVLAASLASPAEAFAAKAAALEGKKDAKAWLALSDWAGDHLLLEEREQALKAVLAFDPENAKAHDRLDEKKWDGAWMPAAEAEAREIEAMEAKGLAFYGTKWLPLAEADRLRDLDSGVLGLPVRNRVDTPHLKVFTQYPLADSLKMAWTLEHAVETYLRLYKGIWDPPRRWEAVPVLAFKDPDAYRLRHRKAGREIAEDGTSSYFPEEGVWACAQAGDADTLIRRSLSPLVCALDDRVARIRCDEFPAWLHAGSKRLMEYALSGRRVFPGLLDGPMGRIRPGLEEGLAAISLKDLVTKGYDDFQRGDAAASIGQSLALVHFLWLSEDGRHAEGLRRFLRGLPQKASLKDFEREVAKASDLEAPFKRYVKEVFLPMAKQSRD